MKNTQHEHPIVCLDAGHYGKYNAGAVSGYYESEMAWKLAKMVESELTAYGIEVRPTRTDPSVDIEVYQRGKLAEGCDLMVSLHSNAAKTEYTDYVAVMCSIDHKVDELGDAVAKKISSIMQTTQPFQRWNSTRSKDGKDYYGVLRGAAKGGVPGIIVEHSFHTNKKACTFLMDDSNLAQLAVADAEAIANHFGIEKQKTVSVDLPVLKKGAKGEPVAAMQALLLLRDVGMGAYGADGSFGAATDKAVRAFQQREGLTVDGSVGKNTWRKLLGI